MLMLKRIWAHKNSVSKNIGPKKLGPKIILGQTLVKIRLVLAEICHYTETRTNDAGTHLPGKMSPRQSPTNTDDPTNQPSNFD